MIDAMAQIKDELRHISIDMRALLHTVSILPGDLLWQHPLSPVQYLHPTANHKQTPTESSPPSPTPKNLRYASVVPKMPTVKKEPLTKPPVQPPPIPPPAPVSTRQSAQFGLEAFSPVDRAASVLFPSLAPPIREACPEIVLVEHIPDDTLAQHRATCWKHRSPDTEVLLLCFASSELEKAFLRNLARAISISLRPAQIIDVRTIEKTNAWKELLSSSRLAWVISTPILHAIAPRLVTHLRSHPSQQEDFVENARLLTLAPLTTYTQNPRQKYRLWQALCRILS